MVKTIFIHTILKRLERYLIKKNGFRLFGDNYDLILFIPSDKYQSDTKYSLMLSAKTLNALHQREVIKELLFDFKEVLRSEEYNCISRLNIIHSEDPFVKNLKLVFGFREEVIEINEIPIGGFKIDFGYLVKSLVLDKLIDNRALIIEVKNAEGRIDKMNAGIIRIEENFDVVFYSGKGLREIWKPQMTATEQANADLLKQKPEAFLIEKQYIMKANIDNIVKVL